MTEVVSVQFRGRGKSYYFDPAGIDVSTGDMLVVETSKGIELGNCTEGKHCVEDCMVVQPLRPVVRVATADDRRVAEINRRREEEAFTIAEEKILKHGLEMKLVDVECSFEGNKILFFFTADGRVDFRELVKDLAGVFRTRIELRQIGVRDEAKMLGGIGICGQPFCCSRFLNDFQPVSTKMAKTQSISLNPAKISGSCGRLMCCLRYEQEAYEDLIKHVPKNGAFVQTEDGYGNVVLVNLLRQSVKVRLDGTGDPVFRTFPVDEIAEVPGGRPAEGEPLPNVLKPRPKKEKIEEPENPWAMPQVLPEPIAERASESRTEDGEKPAEDKRPANRRRSRGSRGRGGEKRAAAGERPAAEKAEKPRGEQDGRKSGKPRPAQQNAKKSAPAERRENTERKAVQQAAGDKPQGAHRSRRHRKPHAKPQGGENK